MPVMVPPVPTPLIRKSIWEGGVIDMMGAGAINMYGAGKAIGPRIDQPQPTSPPAAAIHHHHPCAICPSPPPHLPARRLPDLRTGALVVHLGVGWVGWRLTVSWLIGGCGRLAASLLSKVLESEMRCACERRTLGLLGFSNCCRMNESGVLAEISWAFWTAPCL